MKELESVREWGGYLKRYSHSSSSCNCDMTFSVFLPPQAEKAPVPVVYFLSGLTCTDDNVRTKAGAQRYASELGIALVMPDTSPRGDQVADDPERYDLGQGAGFYIDATQSPWQPHYHMYSYVVDELPALVESNFPVLKDRRSITGHSMGGHGALIVALKNEDKYQSVSAFAPICNPVNCGWGEGCFGAYLGDDKAEWNVWDATQLIAGGAKAPPMKIDQGAADEFLDEYLHPNALIDACKKAGVSLDFAMREGYDHSYHFISTYIGEHLTFHAKHLA